MLMILTGSCRGCHREPINVNCKKKLILLSIFVLLLDIFTCIKQNALNLVFFPWSLTNPQRQKLPMTSSAASSSDIAKEIRPLSSDKGCRSSSGNSTGESSWEEQNRWVWGVGPVGRGERGETHALAVRAVHLGEHCFSVGAPQANDTLTVLVQGMQGSPACATLVAWHFVTNSAKNLL